MEEYYANNCILGGKSQPARNTCPSVHISLHKAMKGKNSEQCISWEMQKYNMLRNRTGNICGTELMTTRLSPARCSNAQSHFRILLKQPPGVEPVKVHPLLQKPSYLSLPPASFAIRFELSDYFNKCTMSRVMFTSLRLRSEELVFSFRF